MRVVFTRIVFTVMRDNIDPSKRALQEIDTNQPPSEPSQTEVSASMETVPADFIDGFSDPEPSEDQAEIWGRLFPLSPNFDSVDMSTDVYTFGRGEECDYQFQITSVNSAKNTSVFQTYSKTHFIIKRDNKSSGTYTFLEDKSSNGTFVNGERVGKGNVQALKNNDEISLSLDKNRAFIYIDSSADESLPDDLKEKYVMAKVLGTGAYGVVHLAFEKGSANRVAIKCIQKTYGKGIDMSQAIRREVQILKSLQHPCIVSVLDVIDGKDKIYIVLELVEGGELFDRLVQIDHFEEAEAKVLFYQIVHALKYLHDQNIAHRDLKLENILVCSKDTNETLVKINDFGVSKFVDAQTKLQTYCGTPDYLAPEILRSKGLSAYTNAVDVWSLGVMLYVCLGGLMPFRQDREDKMDLHVQITGGHYEFNPHFFKGVSREAISLIKEMLTVDPEKRITIVGVLEHPWLQNKEAVEKAEKLMYSNSCMEPPITSQKKRKRPDEDEGPSKHK